MGSKLYIKTFGCQMNDYDSGKMAAVLEKSHQVERTDNPEEADILLLNTCSIREKAQEKVFSELGRWKQRKQNQPDLVIGVGGCVASQEGDAILERAPYVDMVFGPQTLHRLPELMEQRKKQQGPAIDISFPEIEKFDALPAPTAEGVTAFVSIMEGCSKYCTFCVVPYTRGEEVSRPFQDVMAEVSALAAQGVREITLLGQNVNAYAGPMADGTIADLALLIRYIAEIDSIGRIRFTTSHPAEFSDSLIQAYADVPKLASYLHLPVQSGSDRILMMMKRGHSAQEYISKIQRLRAARQDISLSTDIIVGFPTETDEDFAATMELVGFADFDHAFSFVYSARPGTPAAKLADGVALDLKKQRLQILQDRVRARGAEFSRAMIGSTQRVLVERLARKHAGQVAGRTDNNRWVNFEAEPELIGRFVDVRITEALPNSLRGELTGEYPTLLDSHPLNISKHMRLLPESQERLLQLCGPFDGHLRQLEKDLSVEIRNRGHEFEVEGPSAAVELAMITLKRLYAGAERSAVSPEDVHIAAREREDEGDEPKSAGTALGIRTRRGVIRPRNPNQRQYLAAIAQDDLVFGIGPAGTGKTYLAVAAAVEALERDEVRRIMLVRPAVEAGERLGFLPGDLAQKIDPYLRPLYDALYEMLGFERVGRLIERNIIEVAPLAYMRGRTLNEAFVIMDEAQNATVAQMKMFLTRLGFSSTAVVTGDVTQVDLPRHEKSGLRHACEVLKDVPGIGFTWFRSSDVVRHPLVQRIVDAYELSDEDPS